MWRHAIPASILDMTVPHRPLLTLHFTATTQISQQSFILLFPKMWSTFLTLLFAERISPDTNKLICTRRSLSHNLLKTNYNRCCVNHHIAKRYLRAAAKKSQLKVCSNFHSIMSNDSVIRDYQLLQTCNLDQSRLTFYCQ